MMIILVGFVRAEDAKEMVVGNVKELKDVKTKKVTWKKDRAKMVLLSFTSGEIGKRKDRINPILSTVIDNNKIPGIVAAISSSKGLLFSSASGIRRFNNPDPMKTDDLVHLGSCTKAMTSTLLAILITEGKLNWESTLIEALPELKDLIHPNYELATLRKLVTHRSGMPANANNWWDHSDERDIKVRRLKILKDSLATEPSTKVGDYLYSNLGYMVAGCMAEKVTGKSWETLTQEKLFQPLGMNTASFGPPGTPGQSDQPWGHLESDTGWEASQLDNSEPLGPAGRVHCSLADWAKFLALQLPNSNPIIQNQQQLDQLIEPVGNYAAGWGVYQDNRVKGTVLTHDGSNTMWYARVWVAPNIDRAYMVVMNAVFKNSNKSATICEQVISELIKIDQEQ